MVNLGYFAIRAKVVGFRDPVSYSKGFKYTLCTYLESNQLVKHDMLWCEKGWATLYPEKIKVVNDYLTNPNIVTNRTLSRFSLAMVPKC